MGKNNLTHTRVEKVILDLTKLELPLYRPYEIFRAGYISLRAYNKIGSGLYGKKIWNRREPHKKNK